MVAITSHTLHLPEKNPVITIDPCRPNAEDVLHLPNLQPGNSPHQFNTTVSNLLEMRNQNTPTTSPKENIAAMWHEIHGSDDWDGLLAPLHPWVRREIIKYGEFAQATYDAFDFDPYSKYGGSCRYSPQRLFEKVGLRKNGYVVSKYIYAMSKVDLPHWLIRSLLGDTWSKDSNWMGYVAVSNDNESHRIGRRDIVVAWRGTKTPSEWSKNIQYKLVAIGDKDGDEEVMVEDGFLSIYTSKSELTRYNKSSASEQVMKEVKRLVSLFQQKGEEVSLTITGHSLGGALALLCAHEAKSSFDDIPISVISFGAPRVGNALFRDKLNQMQVKTLRVVSKQDVVPKVPGVLFNENLQMFEKITGWTLKGVYWHVGLKLKLDVKASPYLKDGIKLSGFHSLETYLHLVDGYYSAESFRLNSRRDVALVNKGSNMLVEELKVPEFWYQLANKGLVCNSYGRWVQPPKDHEDIPSPTRAEECYYT